MEPNLILITSASILGATGLALIFVGVLMAILIALGNKQYIYGVLIFLLFPMAYVYCLANKSQSSYAARLLWIGLSLMLVFFALLWWEVDRLGLDFIEMMKTTTPKHDLK